MHSKERNPAGGMRAALRTGAGQCAVGICLAMAWATGGAAAEGNAVSEPMSASLAAAPAGDATRGRALFSGTQPLQNRAMPCIGCHNAADVGGLGGGTLASDLSDAGTRYESPAVLAPLLAKETPISTMQAVYGPRALTEVEIADLGAYLVSQKTPPREGATLTFIGLGFLGMLVLAGLSQILWRKRLTGVRRRLTGGR